MSEDQLTVEDILSEAQGEEEGPYHSMLEIWREVIKPANAERFKKITPQWANRIVTTYQGLVYQDMPRFRDAYFSHILELAAILDDEIAIDDECLNVMDTEEDVANNGTHYLNIIMNWQVAFLQWELDWDCSDPFAATDLAAISETHKMFFADTGLLSLLDQINFVLTDEDQSAMAEALMDRQAAAQEG